MALKVVVASKNPVKLNAVKLGFEKMFGSKNFLYEGVAVSSNVSDQPMDSKETLQGAINRVANAKLSKPDADYWVGIEGGIENVDNQMEVFAWVVIHSKELQGKARTASFFLPKKIADLVNSGMELGDADDIVFGKSNSKQKSGAVGLLTNGIIDRTQYYVEPVVLGLIPFVNEAYYNIN